MNSHGNQAEPTQRIIGLTGGIGMGKTTISDYLATVHQLPVLDADIYSREAVEPNSLILERIAERYGSGVLLPDGNLDRKRLGDIVFSSPAERLWLEQQIHPYVRDRIETALKTAPFRDWQQQPIIVIVIPLLFEARMTDLVTETWVVQCPTEKQLVWLIERDRLSPEQAQTRINSQMAIQKKTIYADIVLDNSSTMEDLYQQVDRALKTRPTRLTAR
jgi:dephospho-CoA kinase